MGWLVPLLSRALQSSPMHGLARSHHSYPNLCLWALSEGSSGMVRLSASSLWGVEAQGWSPQSPTHDHDPQCRPWEGQGRTLLLGLAGGTREPVALRVH